MKCENLHLIGMDPIDNPVALHHEFSNDLTSNLWDHATRTGKLSKTVRGSEHAFRKQFSVSGSVTSDEETDRIEVFQSLNSPG